MPLWLKMKYLKYEISYILYTWCQGFKSLNQYQYHWWFMVWEINNFLRRKKELNCMRNQQYQIFHIDNFGNISTWIIGFISCWIPQNQTKCLQYINIEWYISLAKHLYIHISALPHNYVAWILLRIIIHALDVSNTNIS